MTPREGAQRQPLGLGRFFALALLLCAGAALAQAQIPRPQVEVFHWWVSGGERASMDVLRSTIERQGIGWKEGSVGGSGTARYTDVLAARVHAGQVPTAAQMIGYDIHTWAQRGWLQSLNDVAEREEWDAVVPSDIQHLSKWQGQWVAAPFNTHSTNWLWVNQALAQRLGVLQPPDTWADLIALLDKARAAGIVPLAMGREAWEHTLLFESVAVGAGGAAFYRKAFIDLDASVLTEPLLATIFARMRQLAGYLDSGYRQRRWDQATDQVRRGQALLQVQGSWVDGEFTAHGLQPGRDYACWRFPDTQGVVLFNSDQFVFFKQPPAQQAAQQALASTLMRPSLQAELNVRSGAAPARVDVPHTDFNACGRRAISDIRAANMRRTLMGSVAMGNAHPAHIKTAIYDVVTRHLRGALSDAQAAEQLRRALSTSAPPAPTEHRLGRSGHAHTPPQKASPP